MPLKPVLVEAVLLRSCLICRKRSHHACHELVWTGIAMFSGDISESLDLPKNYRVFRSA